MLQEKKFSFEASSPERKSEETFPKSPIPGGNSYQKEKFQRSVDLRPTEVRLSKNSDDAMVDLHLGRENEGSAPRIPVNEMRKAGQKPRRILPYLPPVVKELLRWSIHPDQVLRGAASVSYLFTPPVIEEEALPTADLNETIEKPEVPKEKRMLPSIPTTDNRALPSKVPSQAGKQVLKPKTKFRRRILPPLPMIREQTSPISTGEESNALKPEGRQTTSKSEVKEELQTLEHVTGCKEEHDATVPSVLDDHPKAKRENRNNLPSGSNVLPDARVPEELLHVRAKLARSKKTMFSSELPERRSVHSKPVNTKPVLLPIIKKEQVVPIPPSKSKTTFTRRQPKIPPTTNRSRSNSQLLVSSPPFSVKPVAKNRRPITNRPVSSIQTIQQVMRPKPPSTPKPSFTRSHPKISKVQKQQSPYNQVFDKQIIPNLREQSLHRLVKQPLSSAQMKENCLSITERRQTAMERNSKPPVMKLQLTSQANVRSKR